MLTTTLSEFRKDMKSYLDIVTQSFETLIISRGKDTGVVIISLEEYNSLITTQRELSSRINQQRLDKSIEALKTGKKMIKKLDTLKLLSTTSTNKHYHQTKDFLCNPQNPVNPDSEPNVRGKFHLLQRYF